MTDLSEATLVAGLPVALEIGPKRRVFAQAVGWPGWCRAARDEPRATAALLAYADRYRRAVGPLAAALGSGAPDAVIVERLEGNVTTDFGAPDTVMAFDRRPLAAGEPARLVAFLDASWAAFDAALARFPVPSRQVKPDSGRSPQRMRVHLAGALHAYLGWLTTRPSWKEERGAELEPELRRIMRQAVLALPVGVPFETERRPGAYAVRRECWHALDHAWELQDRP